MSLHTVVLMCIIYIHQVFGGEERVTVYLGQSAVLKTGSDRPWNLTRVQWSIYKNTTYIASLRDRNVTLFDFWRYRGRLELNNNTGDLTIKDVRMNDSLTYTVDLVNADGTRPQHKVHLTVKERLEKPKIHKVLHSLSDGQCHVALNCTVTGRNVILSWTPDEYFNGSYLSGNLNSVNPLSVVFISFSSTGNVTFNCTASSEEQMESTVMTVGCSENTQKCEVCGPCGTSGFCVLCYIVLVALLVAALVYTYRHKEQIKDFCINGPVQFIQNLW
ncbi:SLAM family member 5 [Danio aesculapii]|uniref:SLAM family member 5 n=1 Tax=Danio aesculapii TaxID=1142201 RepID=UPI0024BF626C|nr:SLAM family member 5 [Danio aesculapii]